MTRTAEDVSAWRRLEAEDPETAQLVRNMKATGFDITGVIYVKGKRQAEPTPTELKYSEPFSR